MMSCIEKDKLKLLVWKIRNFFFKLFHPAFWVQNYPTCYQYDAFINKLIDENGITSIARYTAIVGDKKIWIENYPYCFGHIDGYLSNSRVLPAPLTRKKLKKLVGIYERL